MRAAEVFGTRILPIVSTMAGPARTLRSAAPVEAPTSSRICTNAELLTRNYRTAWQPKTSRFSNLAGEYHVTDQENPAQNQSQRSDGTHLRSKQVREIDL